MARKAPVKEFEPEDTSQESPDDDALSPEQSIALHDQENAVSGEEMSKAEMVRRAVAAGMESPGDGTAYIKQHFHVDLPRPMWSSYRAQAKARDAKANGEAPRTRSVPEHQPQAAIMPTGFADDVLQLRELIKQAGGAEELREMAVGLGGLLSKYGKDELGKLITAIG